MQVFHETKYTEAVIERNTMSYIYFSEQETETANATDIAAYLTAHGETVKRVGREKVWDSPSGKVSLNGSVWYSQYEQVGGGAINFVRRYFGKSFPEAVRDLLGQSVGSETKPVVYECREEEKMPFAAPQKHTDMRRVYGYLLNERCLDRDVVYAFAHAGLLYEEPEYHNAVFLGVDEDGTPRHAQKRSTSHASDFKNNVAGSDAYYSFHWNGTGDRLYVFEAPIDMLAYISLHKENWQQHSYVALCSTADRAAIRMLKSNPALKNIYLCLDHDSAGIEGTYRIAGNIRAVGQYNLWRVLPKHKDFDEDLKALHGKTAIPAGSHKKMDVFMSLCDQVQTELLEELPEMCRGERAKQYRLDRLFGVVRSVLSDAERCDDPERRINCYKEAGKALLLGTSPGHTAADIEKSVCAVRTLYQPHRDYDSAERLAADISSDLAGLEAHVNRKDAFAESEAEGICLSLQRIVVNCFRECGNILRESREENAQGFTITQ